MNDGPEYRLIRAAIWPAVVDNLHNHHFALYSGHPQVGGLRASGELLHKEQQRCVQVYSLGAFASGKRISGKLKQHTPNVD